MWPFKRTPANRVGREFTEEDTDKSAVTRLERAIRKQRIEFLRQKLEHMKAKQEEDLLTMQVEQLEEDMYGGDENDIDEHKNDSQDDESPDALLSQLLMRAMSRQGASVNNSQVQSNSAQKLHLSDDQLEEYKAKIPPHLLKKFRKMSEEDILKIGRMYAPDFFEKCDDDTIKRALIALKK